MKYLALLLLCVVPFTHAYAGQQIMFYQMGEKDPAVWNIVKKYFTGKDYQVSMYEGTDNMEKHIENVRRINKAGGALFLAMDFSISETNEIFVAFSDAKAGKKAILGIDEVPAVYADDSKELATLIASSFNKTAKDLPLFPLLGVNIPGIFLRITCTKEDTINVFDKMHESFQKYSIRGLRHER